MEAEFLLIVMLALFVLLACAVSISAWIYVPAMRLTVTAKTMNCAVTLAANFACVGLLWSDGIDLIPGLGPISVQSALLFVALLLAVLHINDMEELHDHRMKLT